LDIASDDWEGASALQLSVLQLITSVNQWCSLSEIRTVKTQKAVFGIVVTAQLPPDLWISEVQRWEAIAWASLQVAIADFAIGPNIRDPGLAEVVIKPRSATDKTLCGSFKMRKAGGFV
jgi:hypothetical protein